MPDKITIQVPPFCGLVSGTSDRVSEVHCPNVRCPHEIKLGLNLFKQIAIKNMFCILCVCVECLPQREVPAYWNANIMSDDDTGIHLTQHFSWYDVQSVSSYYCIIYNIFKTHEAYHL